MKRIFGLSILLWTVLFISVFAQEQNTDLSTEKILTIPSKISYQGVLTDNNGTPLNGSYPMEFGLYISSSGGSFLWSESQNVTVENGIFNVLLGANNPLPPNIAFDVPYWLQVKVSGTVVLPRIELTSSAYSFNTSRIQGNLVSEESPGIDEVLKWTGSVWEPEPDNTGSSVWNQNGNNIYYNSGNVGIGTSSPQELLYVAGGTIEVYPASDGQRGIRLRSADQNKNFILDMKNDGTMQIGANSGIMQLASTFGVESRNLSGTWRPMSASSFDVQSSRSLKTNIKYLDESGTSYWLEQILRMKPANYIFNWQDESAQPQLGFIAEEIPEELKGQGSESVNLYALTSAGIVGIKGLYLMLQKQQEIIIDLQKNIEALKTQETR